MKMAKWEVGVLLAVLLASVGYLGWGQREQHRVSAKTAAVARAASGVKGSAPTLKRGPAKVVKGKKMSSWTTIDPQPGDSSYSGTYVESGTYNGQPAYTNGTYWLWYSTTDRKWALSANKGDTPAFTWGYQGAAVTPSLPANPWGYQSGTAPAPTLAEPPPWIKYGDDAANALTWDDAAKHRYYSHGGPLQGLPGGWDFSALTAGVKSDLPAHIIFGGLPVPFSTGDYVAKIYLIVGETEHLWMQMDLAGQTAGTEWTATVTQGSVAGLPHAVNETWTEYLGILQKAQTLRVKLVRASDNAVLATDDATWTMTVRQPERHLQTGLFIQSPRRE